MGIHEELRDAIHKYVRENPEPSEELKRALEVLGAEAAEYRRRLAEGQALTAQSYERRGLKFVG